MSSGDIELVIGAKRDPAFGMIVMVGLGGVLVEVLKDVVFRQAPFGREEALRMLDGLRTRALLDEMRGRPAVDVSAIADLLAAVPVWVAAMEPWLEELDLNPVPVGRDGAVAVDCVMVSRDKGRKLSTRLDGGSRAHGKRRGGIEMASIGSGLGGGIFLDVRDIADRVEPGCRLALPVDYGGVSMAVTRPLIERGTRDLDIICVPTGGLQVDQLVGAGLVRSVETSAVSLGEAGGAPRFNQAVKDGSIKLKDATCPAVHAGLIAAQKGSPFLPMRGLIGSDVLRHRKDWHVIQNPYSENADPIVLIPAIKPDIAIFHAPMADCQGNVWIGRRKEVALMAYAAAETFVTVERIVDENLLASEMSAAGTLPALYVSAVALAPKGAWPYGLWGEYPTDTAEILRYAKLARTKEGFSDYMGGRQLEVA